MTLYERKNSSCVRNEQCERLLQPYSTLNYICVRMSFGVAGNTTQEMFKVLQEAEHHTKRGFGRL